MSISIVEQEIERLRMAELLAEIYDERAKRALQRKLLIEANNKNPDLATCTERSDARDISEIIIWSPEYNEKFRSLPLLCGDRDPTSTRIKALYRRIKKARLTFYWSTAFCMEDGVAYRFNGNTTSWIAHEFPDLFENARICLTHSICQTIKEVQLLHSQYDAPISSRSPSEIIKTWVTSFRIKMADNLVGPLMSAIEMAKRYQKLREDSNQQDKDKDLLQRKIDILVENIDFFNWMSTEVFQTKNDATQPFARICCLTFYFLLFSCQQNMNKAAEFLKKSIFAQGHEHKANDPCLLLHDTLIKTSAPKSDSEDEKMSALEQMGWCIQSWNAFIQDQPLIKYKPQNGQPLPRIVGMSDEVYSKYEILKKPCFSLRRKSRPSKE